MALPTQDDVLSFFDTLSNWGRWGDDERGTLNHITDDVRSAATRAVRHGRSVSFASEVTVPDDMERSTTTCPVRRRYAGRREHAVQAVGPVAMGRWPLDNCSLEACAATAAELGQWDSSSRWRRWLRRYVGQPGEPDRHVLTAASRCRDVPARHVRRSPAKDSAVARCEGTRLSAGRRNLGVPYVREVGLRNRFRLPCFLEVASRPTSGCVPSLWAVCPARSPAQRAGGPVVPRTTRWGGTTASRRGLSVPAMRSVARANASRLIVAVS